MSINDGSATEINIEAMQDFATSIKSMLKSFESHENCADDKLGNLFDRVRSVTTKLQLLDPTHLQAHSQEVITVSDSRPGSRSRRPVRDGASTGSARSTSSGTEPVDSLIARTPGSTEGIGVVGVEWEEAAEGYEGGAQGEMALRSTLSSREGNGRGSRVDSKSRTSSRSGRTGVGDDGGESTTDYENNIEFGIDADRDVTRSTTSRESTANRTRNSKRRSASTELSGAEEDEGDSEWEDGDEGSKPGRVRRDAIAHKTGHLTGIEVIRARCHVYVRFQHMHWYYYWNTKLFAL